MRAQILRQPFTQFDPEEAPIILARQLDAGMMFGKIVGKPYSKELGTLDATFQWAERVDISALRTFVEGCGETPLITVGVGGSFTAAIFAARLQENRGGVAVAKTTLDFTSSQINLRNANVMIFTGGGRNRDVLSAFDYAIANEAKYVAVICTSRRSVIAERASPFAGATVFEFAVPTRKDGFLATNSLLATLILMARAYTTEDSISWDESIPRAVPETVRFAGLARQTLIVLYSGWGTAAAIDLESKCSEAALSNVLLCDYRSFAHGRHYWLAARGKSSGIVALMSPSENEIAQRTLRLVPKEVPVLLLETRSQGVQAAIDLILRTFYLVDALGKVQGIDPGRPGVPPFGSKIYHLKAQVESPLLRVSELNARTVAIQRKSAGLSLFFSWDRSYSDFVENLELTQFGAVVFDFDGTLCASADRLRGVSILLRKRIVQLARCGILIGIATGRGKSARIALRETVPEGLWKNVMMGYYNGAEIASLTEDNYPRCEAKPARELSELADYLSSLKIQASFKRELRAFQLTLEAKDLNVTSGLVRIIQEFITKTGSSLKLVQSSHSLDVLEVQASKLRVVDACRRVDGESMRNVLCIGDRGGWPGNDFEMLATPFSLSVDTVSSDPLTCWNLAPAGIRCVPATCFYLSGIKASDRIFRFSLSRSMDWLRKRKVNKG